MSILSGVMSLMILVTFPSWDLTSSQIVVAVVVVDMSTFNGGRQVGWIISLLVRSR